MKSNTSRRMVPHAAYEQKNATIPEEGAVVVKEPVGLVVVPLQCPDASFPHNPTYAEFIHSHVNPSGTVADSVSLSPPLSPTQQSLFDLTYHAARSVIASQSPIGESNGSGSGGGGGGGGGAGALSSRAARRLSSHANLRSQHTYFQISHENDTAI